MTYTIDLKRHASPQAAGKAFAELVASRKTCPNCGANCPVYHDAKKAAYYMRHQNRRGAWCKMSGKKAA